MFLIRQEMTKTAPHKALASKGGVWVERAGRPGSRHGGSITLVAVHHRSGWGAGGKASDGPISQHSLELLGNSCDLLHTVLMCSQVALEGLVLADEGFDVRQGGCLVVPVLQHGFLPWGGAEGRRHLDNNAPGVQQRPVQPGARKWHRSTSYLAENGAMKTRNFQNLFP